MGPWANTWPRIFAQPKQAPHNSLLLVFGPAWPMLCDMLGLVGWEDKAQLNGGMRTVCYPVPYITFRSYRLKSI